MTGFMTNLDKTTARGIIINMTSTVKTQAEAIRTAKGPQAVRRAVARFERLNAERVRLIQEHGLESWAASL